MKQRPDTLFLKDILNSIQKIETYTKDGKKTFLETEMIQESVMYNFQVIGEATKHLSKELRDTHPEIPWRKIAGFRDVLIHNYVGINIEAVWNVVEKNLPELKRKISQVLQIVEEKESVNKRSNIKKFQQEFER
ncbi:MAG: DUF86 domain-containing protein [Brevibacillus sp.]|nr:DUF86 domain-containing protein [Brevibacillus sp.]